MLALVIIRRRSIHGWRVLLQFASCLFILMCSLFFQMATLFHAQNKVSIVQVLVMDTDNQFKPSASPLTYSTKSNWPFGRPDILLQTSGTAPIFQWVADVTLTAPEGEKNAISQIKVGSIQHANLVKNSINIGVPPNIIFLRIHSQN